MPELPEVEIVKRSLESLLIGKSVRSIDVRYPRIVRTPPVVEEFKVLLVDQSIRNIKRKGKYLLFEFDLVTLISHLRMEGKYIYLEKRQKIYDKHSHVIFYFDDGSELLYKDIRKFGTMDVVENAKINDFPALKKLGQEPLDPEFDISRFAKELRQKKTPIKILLLNQKVICGLGNIYVDDSLAMSHIHPLRDSNTLKDEEIDSLINSIRIVLKKSIENGGSTIKTYESIYGKGSMQEHLIAYGKTDRPCIYCGTPIKKIRVGGRGTHYCPNCQLIK